MGTAGAWTIHIVLIVCLKILYDTLPGVSQETSWTLTNISYMLGSYIMFHYVRGIPFDFNSGAYDNLNMWEQIDHGDQFTPSKKFLLSVPIVLFLLSTHYSRYDLSLFIVNLLAVLAVVIPKLPSVSFPPHPAGEEACYFRVVSVSPQACETATANGIVELRVIACGSASSPDPMTGDGDCVNTRSFDCFSTTILGEGLLLDLHQGDTLRVILAFFFVFQYSQRTPLTM